MQFKFNPKDKKPGKKKLWTQLALGKICLLQKNVNITGVASLLLFKKVKLIFFSSQFF